MTMTIGHNFDESQPFVLIVMGVSGCGKTTIAKLLSEKLSIEFVEADDFHSQQSKDHMAKGLPLTDEMREPWIKALVSYLSQDNKTSKVLAYSGLRKKHRARFRRLGMPCIFIHLVVDQEELQQRINQRENHFMPSSLLASQFAALDSTSTETDVIEIDAAKLPQNIIAEIYIALDLRPR